MAELRSFHFTVTLSGAAEALPMSAGGGGVRWISLQPGAANANPVYVGGEGVSSTDYGTRLPAASGGLPPPPHVIAEFQDGTVRAVDLYVIGTAAEKLHVHGLTFL